MDNGTMVEVFKCLNYCQLAKISIVSKRFWNLISNHRRLLAFLYVDTISMESINHDSAFVRLFNTWLTKEAYNEWVICNKYSKQIPPESQIVGKRSRHYGDVYELRADIRYKGYSSEKRNIFLACANLVYEYWPLFEYFVRLLTDPFVFIRSLELIPQNEFLNLLATTVGPDQNRLQCKELTFNLEGNVKKYLNWIQNHVRCGKFIINDNTSSIYNEELIRLFATGARCTSVIETSLSQYNLPKVVIIGLVQKFIDLKNGDECQIVEYIQCIISKRSAEMLKRDYCEFIVKEEKDDSTEHVFEFTNNNIRKKLLLTTTTDIRYRSTAISLKIEHL
ncbi:hypothetical protein Ddc_21701 [Ditylenchus destructor]|nr:hypothetical protein Ddc_21701 [Ditylenchus destructor]